MDRRSRRTRNALTTALMALLKERPLKSITVTELAELADVNRATFYVHFQDVYDMFDQVKEEFCNICRELVDAHGEELARNENRPFLEDIFSYFETNEDAFAIVFGDNADGAFLGDVIDVVRDSCLTAVAPLEAVERRERDQGLTPNRDRALGMALCNYQFDFIAGGIVPIFCCGESLETREAGEHVAFVTAQIKAGLEGVEISSGDQLVIAYEPIWAIGTGKTATADDAQEVCGAIRATLVEIFGEDIANGIRVLYGGSAKPENIAGFLEKEDVDGALVGGASLKADSFSAMVVKAGE